jgi:hypothetical protein
VAADWEAQDNQGRHRGPNARGGPAGFGAANRERGQDRRVAAVEARAEAEVDWEALLPPELRQAATRALGDFDP